MSINYKRLYKSIVRIIDESPPTILIIAIILHKKHLMKYIMQKYDYAKFELADDFDLSKNFSCTNTYLTFDHVIEFITPYDIKISNNNETQTFFNYFYMDYLKSLSYLAILSKNLETIELLCKHNSFQEKGLLDDNDFSFFNKLYKICGNFNQENKAIDCLRLTLIKMSTHDLVITVNNLKHLPNEEVIIPKLYQNCIIKKYGTGRRLLKTVYPQYCHV